VRDIRERTAAARRVKHWEIIADRLSKAGWSWACVSAVDSKGTIFVADAHCGDGKRYVVHADQAVITKGFASVTPHLTIRASEMKTSRREGGDF
jgi:hypothetical protein